MDLFKKIRAARLDGKAIKCFNLGIHEKTIEFLERAKEIDKERSRNEIRNYYLGLSYIQLGMSNKAYNSLSIAYNALAERIKKDGRFYDKFINLSKKYVDFLVANGEVKLASDIAIRTDKVLTDKGYELDPGRTRIITE